MEIVKLNPVETLISNQENQESHWMIMYKLYVNVKNMQEIRQHLIKGKVQAALLKPSLIVDLFQVTVAANRALRSHLKGTMSTKSLYTEVIYNLSPTKKISQALQTYGIGPKDENVLAVVLSSSAEDSFSDIDNLIDGEVKTLENLAEYIDEGAVRKLYKVSDEELKRGCLLDSVLGRMACKDFPVI